MPLRSSLPDPSPLQFDGARSDKENLGKVLAPSSAGSWTSNRQNELEQSVVEKRCTYASENTVNSLATRRGCCSN